MEINFEKLNDYNTSSKQIQLIESIEYIHDEEISTQDMLKVRSVNSFVRKFFEKEFYKYNQVISVNDGLVTCKVYIDGTQVSEATSQTFNHARTQAAILALQEYNYEMLKTWLGLHREDLQAYLSVKH